ncbi:hypothetical protein X777_01532 [Ooceraea biroi]|uniref:Uncharacterized protein n=1 Tax=Ooceraea biroi TaxID=2015173 RepID=A0A026WQG1_OOCBI|nr:hypothetical protein X777_01532 [Ooceraea biroi]
MISTDLCRSPKRQPLYGEHLFGHSPKCFAYHVNGPFVTSNNAHSRIRIQFQRDEQQQIIRFL